MEMSRPAHGALLRWTLADRPGGVELRASLEDGEGLRVTFRAIVAAAERDGFLGFLGALSAGRRGLFRSSDGGLGLYADPRPDGLRFTMEWSKTAHATFGLTLSADDVRRLLAGLPVRG